MSEYKQMTPQMFNSLSPYKKDLLTLETAFDIEFESASMSADYFMEKCELDYREAELLVLVESGSYHMLDSLYTEASEKSSGKVVESLKTIIDSIISFIQKTADMVREKITKVFANNASKQLSADDVASSETFNMVVNIEYDKKLKEMEDKMSEGRKLLRSLGSSVGVDSTTVDGFVNATNSYLEKLPEITCKAAKAGAVAAGVLITAKNFGNIANGLVKGMDKIKMMMTGVKGTLRGKEPEKEKKILVAMGKLSKEYTKISSRIALGASSLNPFSVKRPMDSKISDVAVRTKVHKSGLSNKVPELVTYKSKKGGKEYYLGNNRVF